MHVNHVSSPNGLFAKSPFGNILRTALGAAGANLAATDSRVTGLQLMDAVNTLLPPPGWVWLYGSTPVSLTGTVSGNPATEKQLDINRGGGVRNIYVVDNMGVTRDILRAP